jgi:hypothetical protein
MPSSIDEGVVAVGETDIDCRRLLAGKATNRRVTIGRYGDKEQRNKFTDGELPDLTRCS